MVREGPKRCVFVVSPYTMDGYNFLTYAVFAFKSRIILKKLSPAQLQCFQKLERSSRNVIKYLADLEFMNFQMLAADLPVRA